MPLFKIGSKIISKNNKTYFIADIANHDGSLANKKLLNFRKLGPAAKFQHLKLRL